MPKRHIFKRIISFLLCFSLLLSFGICGASASDGGAVQQFDTYDAEFKATTVQAGSAGPIDITSDVTKIRSNPSWFPDCTIFKVPNNYYQNVVDERHITVKIWDNLVLRPDHEYNLTFSYGYIYALNTELKVVLTIYNSNGSVFKSTELYSVLEKADDVEHKVDFNFLINKSDLPDGYRCSLTITQQQKVRGNVISSSDSWFAFSHYVTLTDLDDDSGWFQKILDAIKAIPSSIKQFFENLGASISQLGDRIGAWFSDLGKSIGGFFTDLWNNIKQSFADVGRWFKELGDRIQGFFVDLYNDIIDGLKRLFIPQEGYFDGKLEEVKLFATEHFGALYQAPTVMVNMLKKFTTMSPTSPRITVPAIAFDLQGKHYQFTDEIVYSFDWVNDSGNALYYFYKFYRGFVTLILFISFGNYCIKKYNEVFGGRSE